MTNPKLSNWSRLTQLSHLTTAPCLCSAASIKFKDWLSKQWQTTSALPNSITKFTKLNTLKLFRINCRRSWRDGQIRKLLPLPNHNPCSHPNLVSRGSTTKICSNNNNPINSVKSQSVSNCPFLRRSLKSRCSLPTRVYTKRKLLGSAQKLKPNNNYIFKSRKKQA